MLKFVYKRIEIPAPSKRKLLDALPLMPYNKGKDGFSLGKCGVREITGRWCFTERRKLEEYDVDTLEKKDRSVQRLWVDAFAIDFTRSLMRVETAAAAERIVDKFESVQGVSVMLEELAVDMNDLHAAFCGRYPKNTLQTIGLEEVLHQKVLMTDANFDLLDEAAREKVLEGHKGRIKRLNFVVKEGTAAYPVRLTRAGAVQFSEEADPATLQVIEDLLINFHKPPGAKDPDKLSTVPEPGEIKPKAAKGRRA